MIVLVLRMKKMSETVEKKKCIGGLRGAPITVALLPLSPTTNVDFMLKFILSNVKGFGTILGQSSGGAATHIKYVLICKSTGTELSQELS